MAPQKHTVDVSGFDRNLGFLLKLAAFVGVVLTGLQMWVASHFVTRDELEKLRVTMQASHQDHMSDYKRIEDGIERLLVERPVNPRRTRGGE